MNLPCPGSSNFYFIGSVGNGNLLKGIAPSRSIISNELLRSFHSVPVGKFHQHHKKALEESGTSRPRTTNKGSFDAPYMGLFLGSCQGRSARWSLSTLTLAKILGFNWQGRQILVPQREGLLANKERMGASVFTERVMEGKFPLSFNYSSEVCDTSQRLSIC